MKKNNLTDGPILKSLVALALPIMGTSFIQMAYSLTDMFWVGEIGSLAVASVGTASFFTWFGYSFVILCRTGAEIGVAQSLGGQDHKSAKKYVNNSIQLNLIFAIIYSLFLIILQSQLIGFFKLKDIKTIEMAKTYLSINAIGLIFNFINPMFTGVFNGMGNSKLPFKINTVGLILNMLFDPFFILGFGPIPKLGVAGAAIATVLAQFFVTVLFLYYIRKLKLEIFKINIFQKFDLKYLKTIISLGLPIALQNGLFAFFAMVIGRLISSFGEAAIAVQQIGSQIESISWNTAGGFSSAISTFIAQNYGAKKEDRILKCYNIALKIAIIFGLFASILLILGAKPIFSIFIKEEETIKMGIVYLKILGLSQLFMCIEITTAGAFNGLGKTFIPALIGIVFTGARIPFAMILSNPNILGLNGVWWTISVSSVLKGIILVPLFFIIVIRNKKVLKC